MDHEKIEMMDDVMKEVFERRLRFHKYVKKEVLYGYMKVGKKDWPVHVLDVLVEKIEHPVE